MLSTRASFRRSKLDFVCLSVIPVSQGLWAVKAWCRSEHVVNQCWMAIRVWWCRSEREVVNQGLMCLKAWYRQSSLGTGRRCLSCSRPLRWRWTCSKSHRHKPRSQNWEDRFQSCICSEIRSEPYGCELKAIYMLPVLFKCKLVQVKIAAPSLAELNYICLLG